MKDNGMPMAWNEPGGNKGSNNNDNKDPWGRNQNNNNDGPPDLDEVFKNFQKKFKKMFGNSGNNGGGYSSSGGNGAGFKFANISFLVVFIAALVLYVISGFYVIRPAEQGVITRLGKYTRTVTQGPHWLPKFIENVKIINTEKLISTQHKGAMLTKDENIVEVDVEVQYRILDAEKYLFNVREPDKLLREAADSALRQVIGTNTLDDVMTIRKGAVQEDIKQQLRQILENSSTGLFVATVNYKDARAPEAVKDAFDDVTKAREDEQKLKLQADGYANKILPEARGRAARMLEEAEGYKQEVILLAEGEAKKFELALPEYKTAPGITKTRLYIDAMQEVLEKSSKILVDVNAGNNLLYLPIDKILSDKNKSEIKVRYPEKVEQSNYSDNSEANDEILRRRRG